MEKDTSVIRKITEDKAEDEASSVVFFIRKLQQGGNG